MFKLPVIFRNSDYNLKNVDPRSPQHSINQKKFPFPLFLVEISIKKLRSLISYMYAFQTLSDDAFLLLFAI